MGYSLSVITGFRHQGLKVLFEAGSGRDVRPQHVKRLRLILARLHASQSPKDMNLPGLGLHALKGKHKFHHAVSVSGNWRVTFRFEGADATDVDYTDYH